VIGIAWQVGEDESLEDAIRQATLRHREKFGCQPDCILVDLVTAKSLTVKGLTVIVNPFIGKSYTFLLYQRQRFDTFLLHQQRFKERNRRYQGQKGSTRCQ